MSNSNYLDKLRIGGVDRPVRDSETEGRVTTLENKLGANNGIATLGADGKVPSSQLHSYVDDVIEGYLKAADGKFYTTLENDTYSGEITGETGKIYVNLSTNKSYRWGGSAYTEISSSDVSGIKVGPSGSTINPSGGIITIPAYEEGAQAHIAPTSLEVKSALGTGSGTSKYLREDGTWQTPPNDNTTYEFNTPYNASTNKAATMADVAGGNTAFAEAVTFGTGVNTATSVASVPVDKSLCIVTIADGQTAQSFSLASAPSAGRTIHVMVDNSGNTSDLTITVPHGTTNGINYVNTNDLASGSMEVGAGKIGEINIVYASSKAWVRYIGA